LDGERVKPAGTFRASFSAIISDDVNTLKNPSPSDFYAAFLRIVNRERVALTEGWSSNLRHTAVMFERIVPAVADEIGMSYYIPYFGIDTIFCHEFDVINFRNPNLRCPAKYISVALEHENGCDTAAEEMNRLQIYNAPLTVLITYPYPQTDAGGAKLLDKYAGIVRDADVFGNASTERKQLAIFGYPGQRWEAFVYADGTFTPLILALETSTTI
jgi:hypothetical protein